ncbi:MAG: AAA family ATPase, partial [Thermoproteota archaeon]|nr:AAA family ATPase [Thermoproteota archaeon]
MCSEDSVSKRLRINALLVGETGLDKSALLRAAAELVPNSKYTSTLNSSVRSLIAIVVQEDDQYILRQGPVPAASGAICAINEIGRMNYEDQAGFLDAMQEGKIPFGKYGFNTTLNGSATFVMSANPTNNSSWRDAEKINLNEIPVIMPLLDRFDLFFVFRTVREKTKIAEYAFKKTDPHMMSDALQEQEDKNYDFLRKYVLYSKRFHPNLSEGARIMLVEYYFNIAIKFGSPRILDALLRITHAIARLKQKEIVETKDAIEAMEFYNVILQQLSEVVTIPKNPNDLAIDEITNILNVSRVPYDFTELVREVCKRNELVARYIGDNFSVEKNKKLRRLRDRFKEGIDNRILILKLKPLVLSWRSTYDDANNDSHKSTDNNNCYSLEGTKCKIPSTYQREEQQEFNSDSLHSTDLSDLSDVEKNDHSPKNREGNSSTDTRNKALG